MILSDRSIILFGTFESKCFFYQDIILFLVSYLNEWMNFSLSNQWKILKFQTNWTKYIDQSLLYHNIFWHLKIFQFSRENLRVKYRFPSSHVGSRIMRGSEPALWKWRNVTSGNNQTFVSVTHIHNHFNHTKIFFSLRQTLWRQIYISYTWLATRKLGQFVSRCSGSCSCSKWLCLTQNT